MVESFSNLEILEMDLKKQTESNLSDVWYLRALASIQGTVKHTAVCIILFHKGKRGQFWPDLSGSPEYVSVFKAWDQIKFSRKRSRAKTAELYTPGLFEQGLYAIAPGERQSGTCVCVTFFTF